MAYYARLLFLLASLSITVCFAEELPTETIIVDLKNRLHLEDKQEKVVTCEVTNNDGKKELVYPRGRSTIGRYELNVYDPCKVDVHLMTEKDSGIWTLTTTFKVSDVNETRYKKYNVKVKTLHRLTPSNPQKINVFPNQQVSLRFHEKLNNLESCYLLNPKRVETAINKSSESMKSGKCGFIIEAVKPEHAGMWTLVAEMNNNTAYSIDYNINVEDSAYLHPNRTSIKLQRGQKGSISIGWRNGPKICIFEDPHGIRRSMVDSSYRVMESCSYNIPTVTEQDEGIWKVHYGLDGYLNLMTQEVEVRTFNAESTFNSSVDYTKNGKINLLCQVNGEHLKFCAFVRPDGEIFHMTYGVGNSKYEYFGNGLDMSESILHSEKNYDCGITILKPSTEDYGSWKCLVKFHSERKVAGRILKVNPPGTLDMFDTINSTVTGNDVYVKRGDSFKVKCQAQELLQYCWLRSPNGTIFSVLEEKSDTSDKVFKYDGQGLELGECGAEIENANDSYAGKWTCHMGVSNGPELEGSFKVILQDTNLMAVKDVVPVASKGETNLSCQPLPESNQMIESCRWVNPAGYGINVDDSGRYVTETKTTYCKLSIKEINTDEDIGEWRCYARFVNDQTKEQSAKMEVKSHVRLGFGNANLSLILGIVLATCFAVGLVVGHKIRQRARQADEEIILEKSSKGFP